MMLDRKASLTFLNAPLASLARSLAALVHSGELSLPVLAFFNVGNDFRDC